MQHVNNDKALKTLQLKINKEQTSQRKQEKLEKKYSDFYFYLSYKNEERVQLKKRIFDDILERKKLSEIDKQQKVIEEKKVN